MPTCTDGDGRIGLGAYAGRKPSLQLCLRLTLLTTVLASLCACKGRVPRTHLDEVVETLTRGSRTERLEATDKLAEMGDARAVGPLLARYRDTREDPLVREMSLVGVARLGEPNIFAYVMEQLPAALARGDERNVHPHMLGKALVEGGTKTLPSLIELAKSDNPALRDWAITLLGYYREEPAALSALLDLAHSPAPQVRSRVMSSLGQIAMVKAAPAIKEALADSDPAVRAAAAQAWRNVAYLLSASGVDSK
jgi:hypothetical protein